MQGTIPTARFGHGLACVDNYIYMFGGTVGPFQGTFTATMKNFFTVVEVLKNAPLLHTRMPSSYLARYFM